MGTKFSDFGYCNLCGDTHTNGFKINKKNPFFLNLKCIMIYNSVTTPSTYSYNSLCTSVHSLEIR